MSAEEPVSAYGAYKATNDLANASKNYKKKQNVFAKSSSNKKDKVKKFACAPASRKAAGKKKHLPTKNKKENNVYGKQIFHTEIAKQTSKTDKKKKKNLDKYLAKQLKIDDESNLERSNESFDSAASEDECTVSDLCSGEYTLNEGDTFLEDEENDYGDEFSSTKNDVNQAAEDLVQAIISKANKKRKNSELDENKSISDLKLTNIETKKLKKDGYSNGSLRKSLPAAIHHEAKVEDSNNLCASFGSLEDLKKNTKKKKDVTKSIVTTTSNVKLSPLAPPESVVKLNSIEEGKRVFKWLLNPVTVEDFFAKYWEQKACLIKRQQDSYFSHLISFESIDQMLLQNHVEFTKNIDVTSYKNGVRETLNPEGRALPPVVWDHYAQGCSIRLLNPQTFLPAVYKLCATLQEFFHCLVGANAYLTPPNSQGFAPHYDDIEAFVLQIEGRKRWKLYKPLRNGDILPRYSSHNFNQEDIGKPVLEEVLEPGDVLYFPRGTIHQACTEPGYHSLHITLSAYQKQSFADLFEKMLPLMLQRAIDKNLELRRGLPLNVFQHAGIVYSGQATEERTALKNKVNSLMRKCIREMPLEDLMDNAVDQLAKRFQHEALPPEILPAEKLRTVFGSKSRTNACGECVYDYDIDERTNVRLLRANILRLVYEEKTIRIYYYLDNSKQYCEYEPNFIEIDSNEAASVEVLIKFYPQYLGVSQLPLPTDEQKINLVTALWERGLLMMEKPFR